ncbi:response regulator [Aliiroseovarius sp. YM-037]|uniref:response regulator n=1 Tax=Aliiroseovarius sp. YM-037 TaxID=3341728 RepID=UPI003A803138
MKILSVDDDQDIISLLAIALRSQGFDDLAFAVSARAAIAEIQTAQTPFDCFLLDIQMPEIDGVELCQQIRELPGYEETPIIMLTAKTDGDSTDSSFASGATDYITKPIEVSELSERILKAERLSRKLDGSSAETENGPPSNTTGVDLLAPLRLLNVRGLVSELSLHNYLSQLARIDDYEVSAVCVRLENACEVSQQLPIGEFYNLLAAVADGIINNIGNDAPILSYLAVGNFILMMRDREEVDTTKIVKTVDSILRDYLPTNTQHAVCVVGDPVGYQQHSEDTCGVIRAAIQSAATKNSQPID